MKYKLLSMFLMIILLADFAPTAFAAVHDAGEADRGNGVSCYFGRWADPITSYIIENADGTISTLDYWANDVDLRTYSKEYKLLSTKKIAMELSIFGAFLSGEKYNYIAFGEYNTGQNDGVEVIRIVKYDKSFNRLGNVSIDGGSIRTRIPFSAGCPRMAESGNTLILHTSRENYTSDDGLNHQDSLTITINTEAMAVIDGEYTFVSHSFDQYVMFDGEHPIFVDHGDGSPRAVTLKATGYDNWYGMIKPNMFEIPGEAGANCTGVSVGGFGISASNYIVAINTVDHSKVTEYTSYNMVGLDLEQRDIVMCVLKKGSTESGALLEDVKHITVGKYVGTDKIASVPYLAALPDDKFAVLWQEFNLNNDCGDLVLLLVDDNGNAIAAEKRFPGYALSNCHPMLDSAGNLTWYTDETNNSGKYLRTFFTINVASKPSSWADDAVTEAKSRGLITPALSADYQGNTTRLEFCEAAVNFIELYYGKDISAVLKDKGLQPIAFSDVHNEKISAAASLGITSGTGSNNFTPGGVLTREQAATMLYNMLLAINFDAGAYIDAGFADAESISSWASTAVNAMYAQGIMSGTSSTSKVFSPKSPYTHEQSILTLNNLYNTVVK